ncbi:hypothetical protein HanRHA438_Chr14g0676971 [Helianthus annuus]|nr:hypothetical protein HanRHA438_Chr14g0676971 [Helianthus annuus]
MSDERNPALADMKDQIVTFNDVQQERNTQKIKALEIYKQKERNSDMKFLSMKTDHIEDEEREI